MTESSSRLRVGLLTGLILAAVAVPLVVLYFAADWSMSPDPGPTRPEKPEVFGPVLRLLAHYPGANAAVVEDAVAAPIRRELVGMEDVETIESISDNNGTLTLQIYLRPRSDARIAQVLAQNRVALAMPVVPAEVQMRGVSITREADAIASAWVLLSSPDLRFDSAYLSNYAHLRIRPELEGMPEVGSVSVGAGGRYGVRVYVDLARLADRRLTVTDVVSALQLKNDPKGVPDPAGEKSPDVGEFADIVVKVDGAGRLVYLRDVARVEVGLSGREEVSLYKGKPVVPLAVKRTPDRTPEEVLDAVGGRVDALRRKLPEGMELTVLPGPSRPGAAGLIVDGRLPASAGAERTRGIADRVARLLGNLDVPRKDDRLFAAVLAMPVGDTAAFRMYLPLAPADAPTSPVRDAQVAVRRALRPVEECLFRVAPAPAALRPPRRRAPVAVTVHAEGIDETSRLADTVAGQMAKDAALTEVYREDRGLVPQLFIDLDARKLAAAGVKRSDVMTEVQLYQGSLSVGEFRRAGRTWEVSVRVDPARGGVRPEDIQRLRVPNSTGDLVPLATFVEIRDVMGPTSICCIDGRRCVLLTAWPAEGVSDEAARRRCRERIEEMRKQRKIPAGGEVEVLDPAGL